MIDHPDVPADTRFSSLHPLAAETPESKIGQIRWMWPEIAAALRAGHSVRAVWKRLQADGPQISYNLLTGYISHQPSQARGGTAITSRPTISNRGAGRGKSWWAKQLGCR